MNIKIKGEQKTSLIDYPGKVATVVFVSLCNFRCPYCHNGELVLNEVKDEITPEEIFKFLEKKKKWLDGVCITGGEPTMHPGLIEFAAEIKKRGLRVKVDTNGTNPEMIQELIDKNLVDYIAMDIKASKENYNNATKVNFDIDIIQKTVKMIMDSNVKYEFRTTVVPGLFNDGEAEKIGKWLKGARKFCLQQFRNNDKTLDPEFQNIGHYHVDRLENFKAIILKYIDDVEIRGI